MKNKFNHKIFNQLRDIWVLPELERRKKEGLIKNNFKINAVQIIFRDNATPTVEVRFNNEVKAIVEFVYKHGVKKNIGDNIYDHELKQLNKIVLTDEEKDAAHITAIEFNNIWHLHFDCRYNKNKVNNFLCIATQFLQTAENALRKDNLNAFVDNSFSAAEILAKADLMLMPGFEKPSHKLIASRVNMHRKLGNVPEDFTHIFNKLQNLRREARYSSSVINLSQKDCNNALKIIKNMQNIIKKKIAV